MTNSETNAHESISDWERTARVLQPMIATVFFLSSLRLIIAQMSLRIYDQLGLGGTVVIGLVVFSAPLLAIPLKRQCTHPAVISALPLAMAVTRVLGQIWNRPDLNWIFAGLTIMLYGLFIPLYAGWLASRESRGIYALTWGIVAAVPLDLCLRALFASADTFFYRGVASLVAVLVLGLILSSRTVTWPRRTVRERIRPLGRGGWADGLILAGLGSTIFLAYTLYLNAAMAGPLANAPYPAAVATSVGIAALAAAALYYDAESVQLLDQSPLGTAILANLALLVSTGLLVFYRPSHWSLPLMAVGLGALLIDVVIYGRLLVSTRGHPSNALSLGLWIGLLLILGLTAPMLLYGADWVLLVAAGFTLLTAIIAGIKLRKRKCPARIVTAASWAWITAVALMILTAGVLFIQPAGPHSEPRDDITLMTYNIRSGYGAADTFDLRRTAGTIIEADADIVVLQEVNRGNGLNGYTDDIIGLMAVLRPAGYRYWTFGPAANLLYGNAIISRYPIVASETFPYDTVVAEDRSVLAARVKIGGRRLAVYSTHLTHVGKSSPERVSQVNQLLALAGSEGLPKAIMGDINTEPDHIEIQLLESRYTDAYLGAGGAPPGYTFRADDPHSRIDYIFTSSDLVPLEARVDTDTLASDHLPLIVRVRIQR